MYDNLHSLPVRLLGADVDDDGQDFAPSSDGAGDLIGTAIVPFKCRLNHTAIRVTETVAGATTTAVIKVWKNGTSGTLLATLTLSTTASGKYAQEVPSSTVHLEKGDRVDFELDVVSAGTGAAGKGYPVVVVEYVPEVDGNMTAVTSV